MKETSPKNPPSALKPVAAAARVVNATQPEKAHGRPRKARPYQIHGRAGWWASPTLPDGPRPLRKFESEALAEEWIQDSYQVLARDQLPALGGPDQATVAQALYKYAYGFTVVKGGAQAELTRINNYLLGGGLPALCLAVDAEGRSKLEQVQPREHAKNLDVWKQYVDARRELRAQTHAITHGALRRVAQDGIGRRGLDGTVLVRQLRASLPRLDGKEATQFMDLSREPDMVAHFVDLLEVLAQRREAQQCNQPLMPHHLPAVKLGRCRSTSALHA